MPRTCCWLQARAIGLLPPLSLICGSASEQRRRGKSAVRGRKSRVPGGPAQWRIAAQSGSPKSFLFPFYSPLPLHKPSGSGLAGLVFPLCAWPNSLSLPIPPTIANQQSLKPISPNQYLCGAVAGAGLVAFREGFQGRHDGCGGQCGVLLSPRRSGGYRILLHGP